MASYTQLYVHCVWSTASRQPLITAALEPTLYSLIATRCQALNCDCYAVGGTCDHIHVLIHFPATIAISNLIGQIKGFSAYAINERMLSQEHFKWQNGYGAFTISKRSIESVRRYVLNQKKHHATQGLIYELECLTSQETP